MGQPRRTTGPWIRFYEALTGDEDARACREIADDACREQPRSALLHLLSSLASKTGDELASARLVLAWLLASLGAPAVTIGLLVPLREAGALLPQLLIAGHLRRLPVRKWAWVIGSVAQGLAVAGMAGVAATTSGASAGWLIVGLLIVFSLARGLCSVAHKDVLGKTIDRARRGKVMGYAGALAGLITIGVGAYLAEARQAPAAATVFVWLLGAAGVLWLAAAAAFAALREAPGATEGGANAGAEALRSVGLLRTDAALRRFVITRGLLLATALSPPFYVALAAERSGAGAAGLGLMLTASGVAGAISAPIWGHLADRSSRRVMIAAALVTGTLGIAVFALDAADRGAMRSPWTFAALFLAISVAHAGARLGRKTYLVDLATEQTRAAYVAVSNSAIGVLLLAGSAFGAVAQQLGSSAAILILALFAFVAAASALRLPEVE
jgi:hypothetical protein